MDLWDKDSTDLADHVQHWSLLRREAALLTAARVSGVSRAGLQVVPSLASCESKAKDAIQMHLLLKSLQCSSFARETWTLSQTSAEMWRTVPRDTLKKHGYTVEVVFGHEEENKMHYTAWGSVYVPGISPEEGWQKVTSDVDSCGVHYTAWGVRVTYVDFGSEAEKFGGAGDWEVRVKGTVIHSHAPVTSSTDSCCQSVPKPADNDTTLPSTDCVDLGSRTPEEDTRGRGRTSHWPLTSTPAPLPVACRPFSTHQTHSHCDNNHIRKQQEGCHCGGSPVIILKGEPNQLKCMRYRLNRNHRALFQNVSSTWCWSSASTDGGGTRGRVTVTFESEEQRRRFRAKVSIPKGVQCVQGYMPT